MNEPSHHTADKNINNTFFRDFRVVLLLLTYKYYNTEVEK